MRMRKRILLLAILAVSLLALGAGAANASASTAWWLINQSYAPTHMVPGQQAAIIINAVNGGYSTIEGATNEVTFTDKLPAGVEVVEGKEGIEGTSGQASPKNPKHPLYKLTCTNESNTIKCPVNNPILPTESVRLKVLVKVTASAGVQMTNEVHIQGGGIEPADSTHSEESSADPTRFGVESYELRPEDAGGSLDTQAGSHPFQLSTTFNLTKRLFSEVVLGGTERKFYGSPALTKDLHFVLPPGLIGNVANRPKCTGANFNTFLTGGANLCSEQTAIGVASVSILAHPVLGNLTQAVPIFNLVPDPGEPARFGFEIHDVPVVLTTKVRSGKDYGVEVSVHYATESANVLNSQVIFWGVPGDPRHDSQRGWECIQNSYFVDELESFAPCEPANEPDAPAFLSMPTTCTGTPPESTVTGESWPTTGFKEESEPLHSEPLSYAYPFASPFTGCDLLPFQPSIEVQPDKTEASTPTGLNVTIKVPQSSTLSANELSEAAIRDTTLTLPAGMTAGGAAANGLGACDAGQIGFEGFGEDITQQLENNHFTPESAHCPDSSKVGSVRIVTPLLEEELTGSVYLAKVHTSLFESPLVLYLTAEAPKSGIVVKLAGKIDINEANGQLTSKFDGAPPLPFSELKLHLFDGDRATQTTPARCGNYNAAAGFVASSTTAAQPVEVSASPGFAITSGPADEGGACPGGATLPFAPSFTAGVDNSRKKGGAFAPFTVTIDRPDGNQPLQSLTVHEPSGLAAMLASVEPCPASIATQADPHCPASSVVGHSVAYAGLGGSPVGIPGTVYLTGAIPGAPFGLLAVTEAEHVGPFNLGNIPVLSKINVDENTAAATITSNPIPQFAPKPGQPGTSTGLPAQIKKLVVTVDREGFTFNPTNCEPKPITGVMTGWEGGVTSNTRSFQAEGCGALPFKPKLAVEVESKFSRTEGLGVRVVVTAGKGEANIKKTKLVFPTTLPSRLTTIQKACDDKIFNANPANCPEGSVIGTAVAHTPVLKSPLTGPAYLVSHASASFPDAEFVLQGEGIKLVLDGKTDIKKGITSSTFETVPDAPVETFEVKLPHGPHSAFSGFGNLCEKSQNLPTEMVGQNGAFISVTTKAKLVSAIGKSGGEVCGVKHAKKKQTELQKLLKKCKKLKKKKKRAKCQATARKQVRAVATCKKHNKHHKKKMNRCVAKARRTFALKLR